jgi:RNA polymerase sigma-B factor
MKAINSFDPAIRPELKPFARVCVAGEIKRYFRDKRWLIRVSRTGQELLLAAKKAQGELSAELGGSPADGQLADRLGVTADQLRHAYQANQAFAPDAFLREHDAGAGGRPAALLPDAHFPAAGPGAGLPPRPLAGDIIRLFALDPARVRRGRSPRS